MRRARLFIYWRAGAVTIWAPRFRRCCATRMASGTTASTAATTTRNSTSSTFYHWASGGMYVPRADLFNLKPGVIDAVRASPLGKLFHPENLVNHTRGKIGPKTTNIPTKRLRNNPSSPLPPSPPFPLPSPEMQQPTPQLHSSLTPAPRTYTSARIIGFCAVWF